MIETKMQYIGLLRKELKTAMEERGFNTLTPVQEKVLSLDDHGRDMIVRSKTGSGKTLAFCCRF